MGSAIRREELYGRTKRVIVDEDGIELLAGYLTTDGRLLAGEDYTLLYVDPTGSFNGKMAYESAGEPVEPKQSSFKETRELKAIDQAELERFSASSIYPITPPADLPPGLYQTEFNYTASVESHPTLVLIQEGAPCFLLVGSWMEFTPLGKAVSYDLFDASAEETEEEEGDFSFDMF